MTTASFKRVGSTRLYQPPPPDSAYIAFFLWKDPNPPPTIAVTDTWPAGGRPAKYVGWYLSIQADAPLGASFEQALTTALPAPASTSFAWVRWAAGKVEVPLTAEVVADGDGRPVLADDVPVPLPPGQRGFALLKSSPVLTQGSIDAFAFTYPPGPGRQAPTPAGIAFPLSGAGAGSLEFAGLVNARGGARRRAVRGGTAYRKTGLFVQVDPLRPFDGSRTFQSFTGQNYRLLADGGRLLLLEPV